MEVWMNGLALPEEEDEMMVMMVMCRKAKQAFSVMERTSTGFASLNRVNIPEF